MLRVALVSPSYYPVLGGISEQMHGLATGLARRGHRVSLLTGGARGHACEERLGGGVRLFRIGHTFRVPINGGRTALAVAPRLVGEVRDALREPPDLLHVHAPYEWGLPLSSLAAFDGPIVGTFHAAGRSGWGWRLLADAARTRLDRLTLRLAVSRPAARWAEALFGGTYRLLPNAIDAARFAVRPTTERSRAAREPIRLLVVARLEPRKGLEGLLDAIELLCREKLPLRLRVVGEGPLRSRLERRARTLPDAIEFLGRVEPSDLPRVYASADLALAPATYGESFGVVLLEAMAAGLPIVASDLPGYREVLDGSGAGLLATPGDPTAWAEAIRSFALDLAALRQAAWRSREHARRYDWTTILPRVEALYEEAVDRGGSGERARLDPVDQSVTSARAERVMSLSSPLRSVLRRSRSTIPRTFLP
ncbi:MAG: glycosyltransferase family 4 protein [Candidatus Eisenbacteria bacterium]